MNFLFPESGFISRVTLLEFPFLLQYLYVSGAAVHAGARRPVSPQHRRLAARPLQSPLPLPSAHAARPGRARLPRILLSERGQQHGEPGLNPHSAGHQPRQHAGRQRQLPPHARWATANTCWALDQEFIRLLVLKFNHLRLMEIIRLIITLFFLVNFTWFIFRDSDIEVRLFFQYSDFFFPESRVISQNNSGTQVTLFLIYQCFKIQNLKISLFSKKFVFKSQDSGSFFKLLNLFSPDTNFFNNSENFYYLFLFCFSKEQCLLSQNSLSL